MKFYKRQSINYHNPADNSFAVEKDGRLFSDSTESFKLPGGTVAQRPTDTTLGQIRHNTQAFDLETFVRNVWERVRTVRPATITVQNLGNGNYESTIFGPLNSGYRLSYEKSAANIQVYVDNVYQIPFTNYDLTVNPTPVSAATTATSTAGSTTIVLNTLFNIVPGQSISGSTSLPEDATVISLVENTNEIVIDPPLENTLAEGTLLTFNFNTGTYIQFTGAVPAKPVVALLGYDGFFPPG
jgi:hypothetical protein